MSRRLLVVLAVALLAASCSSSETLAMVNGAAITRNDLIAMDAAYEDPLGVKTGENLRQDVTSLIAFEAALQSAEDDYGLVIDDAAIAERIANPPEHWTSVMDTTGADTYSAQHLATITLVADAVVPELVAEEYGGWPAVLESHPDLVAKVCVRHISLASEAEAEDVLARLLAGEDFIALAAELSQDQVSQDGLLVDTDGTCLTSYASLAPEFAVATATAELNTPTGPVPLWGGYSVFRVEERVMPSSVEELAAAPMHYLDLSQAGTYYAGWVSDELRVADVEVSSALGTWSSDGLAILPPGE